MFSTCYNSIIDVIATLTVEQVETILSTLQK